MDYKMINFKKIKIILYILSSLIYIWAFYYLSATLLLNIYLPNTIILRDTKITYSSIWTIGLTNIYLRNVELETGETDIASITFDYVRMRFNPLSFLTDNIMISSIDIDGFDINYKRALIVRPRHRTSLQNIAPSPAPGNTEKDAFIINPEKIIQIDNLNIKNIKNLNAGNIRITDNIFLKLSINIKESIFINSLYGHFDDSYGYRINTDEEIICNLKGYLDQIIKEPISLQELLFSDKNLFHLRVDAKINQNYFSDNLLSNNILNIIGGDGKLSWDLLFISNKIKSIKNYTIDSEAFKIIYEDFAFLGNTRLNILKEEDNLHLKIKMMDISISNGNDTIFYPEGNIYIEVFNPLLYLEKIDLFTDKSYGSISIQRNSNDPLSLYKKFSGKDPDRVFYLSLKNKDHIQ